jgi:hypothetical protein
MTSEPDRKRADLFRLLADADTWARDTRATFAQAMREGRVPTPEEIDALLARTPDSLK